MKPIRILYILLLTLYFSSLHAQGPLTLGSRQYNPGDTIDFEWDGASIGKPYRLAALHLWIDDLSRSRRWKLRYPILNGRAEGSIVIPEDMPAGSYAFNFMGAENHLQMKGMVRKVRIKTARNRETNQMDTIYVEDAPGMIGQDVKYMLLGKQGLLFDSTLQVSPDGRFRLPPIVFGDTASLVFKPEKSKDSYVVDLETPLDSAFTPFHATTVLIRVAGRDSILAAPAEDSARYSFDLNDPYRDVVMMDEVVVTGRTKEDKFEQQYVSPQFRNNLDGKTFSGIDNNDITRFNNVLNFLQSSIPGLMVRSDGIFNSVTWRNDPVTFFIDEIRVDVNAIRNLPGTEIALIKTYPPPATMTSFVFGGAIALYTKRGDYSRQNGPRYYFPVIGYTQGFSYWLNN